MIPDGELLRSRVVTDLAPTLEDALDRRLDGYVVLAPRETLLGGTDDRGVLTFEGGVPALAYHAGTDRGGPPALAERTRAAAGADDGRPPAGDALTAFLENEDAVESIRESAREEAACRAREWGLEDAI